jgi:hypothetical protein
MNGERPPIIEPHPLNMRRDNDPASRRTRDSKNQHNQTDDF